MLRQMKNFLLFTRSVKHFYWDLYHNACSLPSQAQRIVTVVPNTKTFLIKKEFYLLGCHFKQSWRAAADVVTLC